MSTAAGKLIVLELAREEEQMRQNKRAACPDDNQAARDIAVVVTSEDDQVALGVGLFPPPKGTGYWLLTPDQADELGLSLIRHAAKMRDREA